MEGGLFQWEGCSPRQRTSPAQSSRQIARLGAEKSSAQSPLSFVSPCRGKLRTLPCASSPHANRLAGFARGPIDCHAHVAAKNGLDLIRAPAPGGAYKRFRHRRKPWRRANSFRPSRLIFGAPGGPARWGANSARLFQQADFGFFSKKPFPSGDFCDIVDLLNYRNLRQERGYPLLPLAAQRRGAETLPCRPAGRGERGARNGKGQPV